jgi:replicative DNA helicase
MADGQSSTTSLNEASILADILHDKTGADLLTVAPLLKVEDFLDPRNSIIYKTLLDMNKKGIQPNPTALATELDHNKVLEDAGGYDYITYLLTNFTSMAPVMTSVNAVRDQALLARFIATLNTISNDAQTKPIEDISDFIEKAESDILTVTKERRVSDVVKMSDVSSTIVNQLVEQTYFFKKNGKKPNGVTGIETGYEPLDLLTKGWKPQEMIVIGARPSVGKTAFAINLLYNVAKKGTPVVFFSLEMSAASIGMRLLEKTSGLSDLEINSLEFLKGSSRDALLVDAKDDREKAMVSKLARGLEEINSLPFYIDDTSNSVIMDIAAKCKKLKNLLPNLGLVAIDYLGLITAPTKANANGGRQQEVADISRQIKQMARNLNVPVIALSQLSRETEKREDHKPQLSDLRDSGAIEQDADMILMLYRKDYYDHPGEEGTSSHAQADYNNPISQVDVTLLKNRNGKIGDLQYSFDKEHCAFNIVDTQHDGPDEEPFPG